jgi:hypothetical protein
VEFRVPQEVSAVHYYLGVDTDNQEAVWFQAEVGELVVESAVQAVFLYLD